MAPTNQLLAQGFVSALAINGAATDHIQFELDGPVGDIHKGFSRRLSNHDGAYIRTSARKKYDTVFKWRSWTGLSTEELESISRTIGYPIPTGILLENITVTGIHNFSQLPPTSRLVFPKATDSSQAILAVWEENGPCKTVGERLERLHDKPGLKTDFVRAGQGKRGVMGFVLSAGTVAVGDQVFVYPPVT